MTSRAAALARLEPRAIHDQRSTEAHFSTDDDNPRQRTRSFLVVSSPCSRVVSSMPTMSNAAQNSDKQIPLAHAAPTRRYFRFISYRDTASASASARARAHNRSTSTTSSGRVNCCSSSMIPRRRYPSRLLSLRSRDLAISRSRDLAT